MATTGIHHISVLSSDAKKGYEFYRNILGLKLTMKTVNQEDERMYHLFFGDKEGRVGTEYTIFEMKRTKPRTFGTDALERTMFLVRDEEALHYWEERLEKFGVLHYGIEDYGKRKILRFEDEDGQRLGFSYREDINIDDFSPYVHEGVDEKYAILGISELHMRVRYLEATERMLKNYFNFRKVEEIEAFGKDVHIYRFDNNFKHEIHVIVDKTSEKARLGVGGIHHIAFGVESIDELVELADELDSKNINRSIIKNRDFMHSLYFKDATRNVIEVATPLVERNFDVDQSAKFEDVTLFLPDFLEARREEIEKNLK